MSLPEKVGAFLLYAASGAAIPAEWAARGAFQAIGLWIARW
jgi:hypothetical protein